MDVWNDWMAVHPECPPMGDLLRVNVPNRWFRIHALPGGKRTPTDSAEIAEALRRHNAAATAILGIGAHCVAFRTDWEDTDDFARWHRVPPSPRWQLNDDVRELLARATFRYRMLRWRPGDFDLEILAAARGETGRLTVLSTATSAVYCPYEGGADLFVPESGDVASLKRIFHQWLSDLASGL